MNTVPVPKVDVVKRKSALGFAANNPVWDFDCRECKANGYVFVDAIKLEPVSTQTVSGLYFIHNDHLGTPKLLTDSSGTVVWQQHTTPFGEMQETLATGIENLKSLPGQYRDSETGYSYNYFRDYDPSIGRYVQSDPLGLGGGYNTYSYVVGNPLTNSDPMGLYTVAVEGGLVIGGGGTLYCLVTNCLQGIADALFGMSTSNMSAPVNQNSIGKERQDILQACQEDPNSEWAGCLSNTNASGNTRMRPENNK